MDIALRSPASTPLDLRTTPVIRRTSVSSGVPSKNCLPKINMDTTDKNDSDLQSSMPPAMKIRADQQIELIDSVYESCKSYNADEAEHSSMPSASLPISSANHQTPKTTGVLIKANSFAERSAAAQPSFYADDGDTTFGDAESVQLDEASATVPESTTTEDERFDQWYTPCGKISRAASLMSLHPVPYPQTEEEEYYKDDSNSNSASTNATSDSYDDDVFEDNNKPDQSTSVGGGLWSIVSSVMRLASFGQEPPKAAGVSLLKRCATYAGRMTSFCEEGSSSALMNDQVVKTPSNKRRRTKTSGTLSDQQSPPINRSQKITGRPPLKRMRRIPS